MADTILTRDLPVLHLLRESMGSGRYIGGLTHDFYHYPARFSPEVARSIIEVFSKPNDWVIDPFMGGGTAIVEGLALGRRMLGVDINPLAHFVAEARTSPLSPADERAISAWLDESCSILSGAVLDRITPTGVHNLPDRLDRFVAAAIAMLDHLQLGRQSAFARCLLLRLGQWALDCREADVPTHDRLAQQLHRFGGQMLSGLRDLVTACNGAGVHKNKIRGRRILLNLTAVGLNTCPAIRRLESRPKLVITSPPYPGVHVLYHRWQYKGRKETSAPYHIAGLQDGSPASYYTAGSRTPSGVDNYFKTMESAFTSMRAILHKDAVVAQLVGFSDPGSHVKRYSAMMERSGFEPLRDTNGGSIRILRRVHNRKWYHRVRQGRAGGMEVLLLHRLAP